MQNAFALLSEALNEARPNRNALIQHFRRAEASAAAHEEMTTMLASGAEIRQSLERMANRIGDGVFPFDDEFRIIDPRLSTCSTQLPRQRPIAVAAIVSPQSIEGRRRRSAGGVLCEKFHDSRMRPANTRASTIAAGPTEGEAP